MEAQLRFWDIQQEQFDSRNVAEAQIVEGRKARSHHMIEVNDGQCAIKRPNHRLLLSINILHAHFLGAVDCASNDCLPGGMLRPQLLKIDNMI